MSFIATAVGGIAGGLVGGWGAGAVLTGAGIGASIGGANASAEGAKDAAAIGAAGGEREIEFARESRDLARSDQAPYRKAGYKALDAMMSLTGLGGGSGGGGVAPGQSPILPEYQGYGLPSESQRGPQARRSSYRGRAMGGPIDGGMYNINELGPESVYSGGSYSRNSNPVTIDGQTGYVQPNIQGRFRGGPMGIGGVNIDEYLPPGARGGNYGGGGYPGGGLDTGGAVSQDGQTQNFGGNIKLGDTPPGGNANTTALNPQTGYPNENPGGVEGGYQFQTDPGYQFRFEEGMRALDRGAAQRGGLLSGGYGRKAIRYGQGFASNEYTNVYNRISNIAGLGQVSAGQSGQYAMYGGQQMGRGAANSAFSRASGAQAAGNAWANAGNELARFPWGNIFNQPTQTTQPGVSGSKILMPVFDATQNQVLFSPVTNYYQGKAIRQQLKAGEVDIDLKKKTLEQADSKLDLEGRRVDALEDSVATREEANAQAREAMEYKIGQERTAKTAYDLYVMTEKHNRRFAKAGKTEEAMAETLKNVVPDIQAYADSLPEELAEEKAKIKEYLEDGIVTAEEWRGMSESAAEQALYYHPDLFAEGKPTVIADGAMALMPDGSIVENPKDFAPTSADKPDYDAPNSSEIESAEKLIANDPLLDDLETSAEKTIAAMTLANDIRQLQEDLGMDYATAAGVAVNQLKRRVRTEKDILTGQDSKLDVGGPGLADNEYLGKDGNIYVEEPDGSFRRKN